MGRMDGERRAADVTSAQFSPEGKRNCLGEGGSLHPWDAFPHLPARIASLSL